MTRLSGFLTITISIAALILFESIINGFVYSIGTTENISPVHLKYFIPSILSAIVVGVPVAYLSKPSALKICVPIGIIWLVINITLIQSVKISSPFGSNDYIIALINSYGPKISSVALLLLVGFVADNYFMKHNET